MITALEQLLTEWDQSSLLDAFEHYAAELLRWNRAKQLTTIRDRESIFDRHFHDSLQAACLIPTGSVLVDIGTGAGLPGIPLALARPDLQVHLVESVQRKVSFLRHIRRQLALENLDIHACRAEQLGSLHAQADVVSARALADIPRLLELGLPFLRPGGKLLFWKTRSEIPETLPGFRIEVREYAGALERACILCIARETQ